MPYLECPGCRLRLYSAATRAWISDSCPVCGESLAGAPKWFPSENGVRTLCREFPSSPGAVAQARHSLDGLYGELGEQLHATAVLLISELVTNSVRHSNVTGGVIELLACITPTYVRVEVSDDGEGFDLPPLPHHDATSGRALQLVQELADRWGCPTGMRTCVWFELDRAAEPLHEAPPLAPEDALVKFEEAR
ncbi:MAG TPA: ATP-binding protein [Thermoleophilaceae bacterium]|nr:ATP-binding protein [Thermoleophilaceae bacterium]